MVINSIEEYNKIINDLMKFHKEETERKDKKKVSKRICKIREDKKRIKELKYKNRKHEMLRIQEIKIRKTLEKYFKGDASQLNILMARIMSKKLIQELGGDATFEDYAQKYLNEMKRREKMRR